LIVRKLGGGFVIHSSKHSLCVDVLEENCSYKVAIKEEGESFDFCPLGRKCKEPTEGWKDLLPFSVLIAPEGLVATDGKASIGIWKVPEAVHVDMVLSEGPVEKEVPVQDLRVLQEDDHVEPLSGTVFRGDQIHRMKLEDKWFELIASGQKVVEGRLYDEKREGIRVGHIIQFKNVKNGNLLYARVKRMVIYSNFREMLESERVARVLPGLDVESGVKVYERFYGPDAGPVLAIGLEVL